MVAPSPLAPSMRPSGEPGQLRLGKRGETCQGSADEAIRASPDHLPATGLAAY